MYINNDKGMQISRDLHLALWIHINIIATHGLIPV